jgi:hypothetical protein
MGFSVVINGIGKGSMFGYGRIFGIHNPLGSDMGKAKDPYINNWTLLRLSCNLRADVRGEACINLAKRIEQGAFLHEKLLTLLTHPERPIIVKVVETILALRSQIEDNLISNPDFINALKLEEVNKDLLKDAVKKILKGISDPYTRVATYEDVEVDDNLKTAFSAYSGGGDAWMGYQADAYYRQLGPSIVTRYVYDSSTNVLSSNLISRLDKVLEIFKGRGIDENEALSILGEIGLTNQELIDRVISTLKQ